MRRPCFLRRRRLALPAPLDQGSARRGWSPGVGRPGSAGRGVRGVRAGAEGPVAGGLRGRPPPVGEARCRAPRARATSTRPSSGSSSLARPSTGPEASLEARSGSRSPRRSGGARSATMRGAPALSSASNSRSNASSQSGRPTAAPTPSRQTRDGPSRGARSPPARYPAPLRDRGKSPPRRGRRRPAGGSCRSRADRRDRESGRRGGPPIPAPRARPARWVRARSLSNEGGSSAGNARGY